MQRILDPAQIEAFAERSIPRVRLPDPASLFARRAQRLRALAERHSLGDYLRLVAAVADGQQVALDALRAALLAYLFPHTLTRQIYPLSLHDDPGHGR